MSQINSVIKIGPSVEPVSDTDAKTFLRVTGTDEDTIIAAIIKAAREYCENFLERALITQTWYLYLDAFSGTEILLPFPPLKTVTSVKYYDTNNAQLTFSESYYWKILTSLPGKVVLKSDASWPATYTRPDAIVVEYTCGYGDTAATVPYAIKQAMQILISQMYDLRTEAISEEMALGVRRLLTPYKCYWL